MNTKQNPNYDLLLLAVDQLGELADEMVFLGGCATGLLITDSGAPAIRPTKDVDAIVQVTTKAGYYQLSDKLRARGFSEDSSDGAPLCRWVTSEVMLDVMPTAADVLGFGNQWYAAAVENAETVSLHNNVSIRMVSAPYFLITKLEAFDGRGKGDYLLSHDVEDIVAVLDGRPEIAEEVKQSEPGLVKALSKRFNALLENHQFLEAVSGHMPADATSQARVPIILNTMNAIADKK